MTDKHSALHFSVPDNIFFLPLHLGYRLESDFGIISRSRKSAGKLAVRVFEIGKVHVHKVFQLFKRFTIFVTAAIVNDGNGKPSFSRFGNNLCDFIGIMRRSYEIRALRSVQLHFDELFGNFFRRNLIADGFKRYPHTRRLRAESVPRRKSLRTFRAAEKSGKLAVAYFEILAVDASEITTAEKNRSASSGAADYRFFPFMDTDVSYDYIVADSAEARGNFAIDSAFPRT